MPPVHRTLTLSVMEGLYAIAKFAPGSSIPAWATNGAFSSITRTADELSVVTSETNLPDRFEASRGWRMLKVQGPFAFSEVGVVASVANPLARVGIGIFVVSTYDTDYLLVQQEDIPGAVETLEHAGHRLQRLDLVNSKSFEERTE